MAQLPGKTIMPIEQLPIDHDTTTETRAECHHHKITHPLRIAIIQLAHSGCIGIIGQDHRQIKMLMEHTQERSDPAPLQIHRILDRTIIIIGIGRTDTHSTDGNTAFCLCQSLAHLSHKLLHKLPGILNIGLNRRLEMRMSLSINKAHLGIRAANINAKHSVFHGNRSG